MNRFLRSASIWLAALLLTACTHAPAVTTGTSTGTGTSTPPPLSDDLRRHNHRSTSASCHRAATYAARNGSSHHGSPSGDPPHAAPAGSLSLLEGTRGH